MTRRPVVDPLAVASFVGATPEGRSGPYRLPTGGHVDRTRTLSFRWNDRPRVGLPGDTLASALLAQGERVVGRGFKFHRPRGVLSAGAEEPNALVSLGRGAELEANARATLVPLVDGLDARAQNCWPSVTFDLGRWLDAFHALWPAGFYNKTFLWPSWHAYEGVIRRTAGLGEAPTLPDPARYEAVHATADVLVVGSGAAGLHAARIAADAGATVMLVEQDVALGGHLLTSSATIDDRPAAEWAAAVGAELAAHPRVRILRSTTAFGVYDHGHVGLCERVAARAPASGIRERYWRVRAAGLVLATGAIDQPGVFPYNDRPGVMLASAVHTYARRFGVAAGQRVALATNHDGAYVAALDLVAAGVRVVALVDGRADGGGALTSRLREAGVDVHLGARVVRAHGGPALSSVTVQPVAGGASFELEVDALGTSSGAAPAVHLWSQGRGRLEFDPERRAFLPVADTAPASAAGAVCGTTSLAAAFASAEAAIVKELARGGRTAPAPRRAAVNELAGRPGSGPDGPPLAAKRNRQWIDFQHDVTVADVELALREGFDHIEHLKRYTTTGMSVDQGKTSNRNALLVVAELTGRPPETFGTTTYRPMYSPVSLGAIAGRQVGEFYAPRRRLPAHDEHVRLGAVFEEAAGWMRPAFYPRPGETRDDAIAREVRAVRTAVGLFDASPLGKIEVEGPDAAWFLDRFYVNNVTTLEIGRTRYGLMLNEHGVIVDDGTIARLGPEHFVVTTTSGGSARVAATLEEWRQCEWPDRAVVVTPVTTQWATMSIAGPRARDVLARLPCDVDLGATAFPHLSVRTGTLAGVPARLYRVSFSGELGYEINVPARYAASLWQALERAGRDAGVTPYGVEALLVLRLEKGFLHVGLDTDGTTTPADVGWGAVALRKPGDYVGRRSLLRPDNVRADRLQLVGLTTAEPSAFVPGAHLRLPGTHEGSDGWITSAAFSPTLNRHVALAMLRGGRDRIGQAVTVHDLDRVGRAEVVTTPFHDPSGARLHG